MKTLVQEKVSETRIATDTFYQLIGIPLVYIRLGSLSVDDASSIFVSRETHSAFLKIHLIAIQDCSKLNNGVPMATLNEPRFSFIVSGRILNSLMNVFYQLAA